MTTFLEGVADGAGNLGRADGAGTLDRAPGAPRLRRLRRTPALRALVRETRLHPSMLVAPLFVHLPVPNAGDVTYTCPMAQGAPDMTARALAAEGSRTRVLRPVLFEREGDGFDSPRARRALRRAAEALAEAAGSAGGLSPERFRAAYTAALASQRRFEDGLRGIGERALAWAREHDYPVVLIAGETHVIHDAVLSPGSSSGTG